MSSIKLFSFISLTLTFFYFLPCNTESDNVRVIEAIMTYKYRVSHLTLTAMHFYPGTKQFNELENEVSRDWYQKRGNNSMYNVTYTIYHIEPKGSSKSVFMHTLISCYPASKSVDENRVLMDITQKISASIAQKLNAMQWNMRGMTMIKRSGCLGKSHDNPDMEWPSSYIGNFVSTICPNELKDYNKFQTKKCTTDGWLNLNKDKCEPYQLLQEVRKIMRVNVLNLSQKHKERLIVFLNSSSDNWQKLNKDYDNMDLILKIVNVLKTNIKNVSRLENRQMRDAVQKAADLYSVENEVYQFKSEYMAMRIEVLPGNQKEHVIEVDTSNSQTRLKPSDSNHMNLHKTPGIVLPLKQFYNAFSSAPQSVHAQVFAYKDASLFSDLGNESEVFSVTIPGFKMRNLVNKLKLYFPNRNKTDYACVFWNHSLRSNKGGWSTKGCGLTKTGGSIIQCSCSHFSSFALMEMKYLDSDTQQNLSFISLVGCIVSAIALGVTIITYMCNRALRKDTPSKILMFICFNLFFTNIILVINSLFVGSYGDDIKTGEPQSEAVCQTVAIFLHFFLLSTLTWMGANGYYMYKALVDAFGMFDNIVLKLSLISFGVPIFIVGITVATGVSNNYGLVLGEMCWLKNDALAFGFILPLLIICICNACVFVVVFYMILRFSRKENDKTRTQQIAKQFKGAMTMVALLGLTWGFGFFATENTAVAFSYLFVISNSFLGVFIFLFYVLLKPAARQPWITTVTMITSTMSTNNPTIGETRTSTWMRYSVKYDHKPTPM